MQLLIPGYYFSLSSLALGTVPAFLFFPITFHSAFCLYEEGKSSSGSGPWSSSQSMLTLGFCSVPFNTGHGSQVMFKLCRRHLSTFWNSFPWPSVTHVMVPIVHTASSSRLLSSLLVSFPLSTSSSATNLFPVRRLSVMPSLAWCFSLGLCTWLIPFLRCQMPFFRSLPWQLWEIVLYLSHFLS